MVELIATLADKDDKIEHVDAKAVENPVIVLIIEVEAATELSTDENNIYMRSELMEELMSPNY